MRDKNNLKVQLSYWRARRGLSMTALHKLAHVSTRTIHKIENEELVPAGNVLRKLADALNITLEDLVVDVTEDDHAA